MTARAFPELEVDARPIPGWPGYLATADGRVVSERLGGPLKAQAHYRTGHLRVRLYGPNAPEQVDSRAYGARLRRGGRHAKVYVHVAVALAWHGPAPFEGAVVRHLDDDPANNAPWNLRWGSRSENEQDKHRSRDNDGFDWATGDLGEVA